MGQACNHGKKSFFCQSGKKTRCRTMAPQAHKNILISFMKFHDGFHYEKDHEFTQAELGEVTATDVLEWFNDKAHGTRRPTEADRPNKTRSNSLLHYKKALSAFMPNRNHQWNELTGVGNPTKSQALNDMIKKVQKYETRGQVAPSKARRPMREAEFRSVISELRKVDNDIISKYGIPALMAFQFHMIGRIDDCSKWFRRNVQVHDLYPDKALKTRLAWSKKRTRRERSPLATCIWMYGSCFLCDIERWLVVGSVPH